MMNLLSNMKKMEPKNSILKIILMKIMILQMKKRRKLQKQPQKQTKITLILKKLCQKLIPMIRHCHQKVTRKSKSTFRS